MFFVAGDVVKVANPSWYKDKCRWGIKIAGKEVVSVASRHCVFSRSIIVITCLKSNAKFIVTRNSGFQTEKKRLFVRSPTCQSPIKNRNSEVFGDEFIKVGGKYKCKEKTLEIAEAAVQRLRRGDDLLDVKSMVVA